MKKADRLARKLERGTWNELAVRDAILETDLPTQHKLVLLAVISHRGRRGGEEDPRVSVRRLAQLASVHKDTPGKVLADLERRGLLRVVRHGERSAARFDLSNTPKTLARMLSGLEGHAVPPKQTASVRPKGTDKGSALSLQNGHAVPPKQTELSGLEGPEGIRDHLKGSKPATSRSPRVKTAARQRRPKAERSAAERAAHKALVAVYFEVYEACKGQPPPFGAREGKAVWDLLDSVGAERAEQAIRNAFADEWGKKRSIRSVADDPAKFLGGPVRRARGGPPQGDHGRTGFENAEMI